MRPCRAACVMTDPSCSRSTDAVESQDDIAHTLPTPMAGGLTGAAPQQSPLQHNVNAVAIDVQLFRICYMGGWSVTSASLLRGVGLPSSRRHRAPPR